MPEKFHFNKVSLFGKFGVLSLLILVGTIFRFCYPFLFHPIDHLISDPERHYLNATSMFNKYIYSWLDPPLPQILLRVLLTVFTNTRCGVSICFGLLNAALPWCWYLWGKQIFSSEKKSLIYLTVLVWLPSWIGIYGYFMDETLLLPALGLTLWLSWKAREKNTAKYLLLAVVAWAITLSIKLNVVFELVIALPWLFANFFKQAGYTMRSSAILLVSILILVAAYLAYPLWVYQGLGATWLYPPGMGAMTKAFYLSGAKSHWATFIKDGKPFASTCVFASNTMQTESLEPFSNWKTWRQGSYHLVVDCDKKFVFTPAMPHLYSAKRIVFIAESALYFFFSRSWPDENPYNLVQIVQVEMRWIWPLLTLSIVALAWQKKRFKDMVVLLCLGSAALCIFSDAAPMEGRYRKPWEGLALAAFIYLFNTAKNSSTYNKSCAEDMA